MTPPLVSAVRVEEGRLNDPTAGETKRWTPETLCPHEPQISCGRGQPL